MFIRTLYVTLTVLLASTTTALGSINLEVVEIDNSVNPLLNGFRTFDLIITTDHQWTTSAIFLELDQGLIYQAPILGAGFQPPPVGIHLPVLEFDTYYGVPNFGQGNEATDIGGPLNWFPPDTVGINQSWGSPQSQFDQAELFSSGTQRAARITLSEDAVGTWSFGTTEVDSPMTKFLNNPINAGTLSLTPLEGDLNRDGIVDILDLNNVLSHWDQAIVDPFGEIDPSGNGLVDIVDLNIVLSDWNVGTPRRPILATPKTFGDLDGDGFVDIFDLKVPNIRWGQEVTPGDPDDPSGDGLVGLDDLSLVMETWNQGVPPSAIVPEPAVLSMLGFGLMLMIKPMRRRD